MSRWKYFSDEEVKGMSEDLVARLDAARGIYGKAIWIPKGNGYRDPLANAAAGGVKDSAHIAGLAVDIPCIDPADQKRLIWALGAVGILRVGVYDRHIHGDIDTSKPWPAYWTGVSH